MKSGTAKRKLAPVKSTESDDDDEPESVARAVTPEMRALGRRLARVRKALGFTQEGLSDRTFEIEKTSIDPKTGEPRYQGLNRPYVVNMEAGRNKLETERVRGVLCQAFKITRDQLADYLDEILSFDDLLEQRLANMQPSKGPPTLRQRADWLQVAAMAKRMLPALRDETLERMADEPSAFSEAPADMIAHLAWGLQEHAAREKGRGQ